MSQPDLHSRAKRGQFLDFIKHMEQPEEKEIPLLQTTDPLHNTLLHSAIAHGRTAVIRVLLDAPEYANCLDPSAVNRDGKTVFEIGDSSRAGCQKGIFLILYFLAQQGVQSWSELDQNNRSRSFEQHVSSYYKPQVNHYFLNSKDDRRNLKTLQAIASALCNNKPDQLISNWETFTSTASNHYRSPALSERSILSALQNQNYDGEDLRWLIKKLTLNKELFLDERDFQGNTPLHLAALRKNPEYVWVLLEAGADLTLKNLSDKTPLDCLDFTGASTPEALKLENCEYLLCDYWARQLIAHELPSHYAFLSQEELTVDLQQRNSIHPRNRERTVEIFTGLTSRLRHHYQRQVQPALRWFKICQERRADLCDANNLFREILRFTALSNTRDDKNKFRP